MKNLTWSVVALFLMFQFAPAQLSAASIVYPTYSAETKPLQISRSSVLSNRLNEIKATDKSSMNFSEKRSLRKETRSIKKELREISGGVYLSTGAIILIVILLIILL